MPTGGASGKAPRSGCTAKSRAARKARPSSAGAVDRLSTEMVIRIAHPAAKMIIPKTTHVKTWTTLARSMRPRTLEYPALASSEMEHGKPLSAFCAQS